MGARFFATSLIPVHIYLYLFNYLHVIMNRHEHHNIRNGIVWAQTGHSTCTSMATWCVIEL